LLIRREVLDGRIVFAAARVCVTMPYDRVEHLAGRRGTFALPPWLHRRRWQAFARGRLRPMEVDRGAVRIAEREGH